MRKLGHLLVVITILVAPLYVMTPVLFHGNSENSNPDSEAVVWKDDSIARELINRETQDSSHHTDFSTMFFTPSPSSEDGIFYICRRGVSPIAYFGISCVYYLADDLAFTLEFPGSRDVVPVGDQPTGSVTNYIYGSDENNWKTGLSDCEVLRYPEIYQGIDLVYKIFEGQIKYEFIVSPGANPNLIRLCYSNADSVSVKPDSVKIMKEGYGLTDSGLKVFQEVNGRMQHIDCSFERLQSNEIIFSLGKFDSSRILVIDPINIVYSSYLGGGSNDNGYGIAVENGYVYMTGYTTGSGFPMANPYDSTYNGDPLDCFVTKFEKDGQSLVYSTYFGGSEMDFGSGIAVENGFAYITGKTQSPSASFPLFNAYDSSLGGTQDCFVAKFNPSGSLNYSTYLGGDGFEEAGDIAVEDGYAYVTGQTLSSNFPTPNGYNTTYDSPSDCFITKFAIDGGSLIYSTFHGGSDSDYGRAIAVENGYVYVAGETKSIAHFPLVNAFDSICNNKEAFVSKLATDGGSLVYSTFLGGGDDDIAMGIAVENRFAYVTGYTKSSNFSTVNPYQSSHQGGTYDCFISKLYTDGGSLVYSSYLGGDATDQCRGISVKNEFAYITGNTYSSNFPIVDSYNSTYGGGQDCFVSKFAPDGQSQISSSFIGGSSSETGSDIAVGNGYVCITGYTYSTNFPMIDGYSSSNAGEWDCFMTIMSEDSDSDGFSDWHEDIHGTNPHQIDTDGDNFLDGYEFNYGSDPNDSSSYPAIPQVWYDSIYEDLDGNTTLIQNLITWSNGNWSLLETVKEQLDENSTLLTKVISWLDGNHSDIETLFTLLDGNATLLVSTVNALNGNATLLQIMVDNLETNATLLSLVVDWLDGNLTAIDALFGIPTINPLTIAYSSYLGGSSDEGGYDIAVEDGYAYVTGITYSTDFPMANAMNSSINGNYDCFLTKFDTDGQSLVYSTYFGGALTEDSYGIAVEDGYVYIVGYTSSTDYPTKNALYSTKNVGMDCFITKFASDGQSLVYSSYLGGSSEDYGITIAAFNGYAYIGGYTQSDDFPTSNPMDSTPNGGIDSFIAKFASDGQSLVYSTYLGGVGADQINDLSVESDCVYVTGRTNSDDFPMINSYNSTPGGADECFVLKLASDGQSISYSTYLGGSLGEFGISIAVEDEFAYVCGRTESSDFPIFNAYDLTHNGGTYDCFVTKLDTDGQSLVYSTYLGGSSHDFGSGIAVEYGYVYVTGRADSVDFPTRNGYDTSYNGDTDCFVTKFASDGQSILSSSYLGGASYDEGASIAVEDSFVYVTGYSDSSDYPTYNAFDSTSNGNWDSFITMLAEDADSDSDGLSDWNEFFLGTDHHLIDTDNDNFHDGYEVAYGSDPTNPLSYPAMPQAWYDSIYEDLDGNTTLIQNLITWADGNSSLLETVMLQLDENATLLIQVISWLDGNHSAIETLYAYVEGNATLLLETVNSLNSNATQLDLIAALVSQNVEQLSQMNSTMIGNITQIRSVLDQLGVTVGDTDYDGLDDLDEISIGTDIQCIDTDTDNLNDAFEVKIGTDPLDDDSDGDTYLDGVEVLAGTDPLDNTDYPGASETTTTATTTTSTTTTTTTSTTTPQDGLIILVVAIGAGAGAIIIIVVIFLKKRPKE